ncbi:hypothetical protein D3C80_2073780 [compost metagenome]
MIYRFIITNAIDNVYTCNIVREHVNLLLSGLLPKHVNFMFSIQLIQMQHFYILLVKMTFRLIQKLQLPNLPSLVLIVAGQVH